MARGDRGSAPRKLVTVDKKVKTGKPLKYQPIQVVEVSKDGIIAIGNVLHLQNRIRPSNPNVVKKNYLTLKNKKSTKKIEYKVTVEVAKLLLDTL